MKTRDTILGFIILVLLGMGCGCFPFLFLGLPLVGLLGIASLISDAIIIIAIRKKASTMKRTKPELFEALRAEAERRAQETLAREIRLTDYPVWIIALLTIVAAVGYAYELGLFQLNTFWGTLVSVLMVLFLIHYFIYQRKIMNKKKKEPVRLRLMKD